MRSLSLYLLLQQRRSRRKNQEQRASRRLQRAGLPLGALLGLIIALSAILAAGLYANLTNGLPPVSQLPARLNPNDGLFLQPTRLFDRSGQKLLFTLEDPGAGRRYLVFDPQKPDHFSPLLIQATIGAMDPSFWQNPGFDWLRLTAAEPITLAERLVDRLLLADEPPGLRRALRMRLLAAQIVSRYGRAQVLEWYLNSAYYGRLAYGAETAAQLYLGKSAAELDLAESALLAAANQAPALNPLDARQAALERQSALLDQYLAQGLIDADLYAAARLAPPQIRQAQPAPAQPAPAFSRLVIDQLMRRYGRVRVEMGGLRVVTSLDFDLQAQLACALQLQLARVEGRPLAADPALCAAGLLLPALPANLRPAAPGVQGSAILLDPTNGQILALAGDSTSSLAGATLGAHAPGSILSPFLAVSAFARGYGPASLVWDIPGQISSDLEKAARPDGQFSGPLRLRQALANDTLVPLQQLLNEIGPANAWQLAGLLGLPGLGQDPDSASLLFQGGGVRLPDLAQAYSALANQGVVFGQRTAPGDRLESVTLLSVEDDQGRRLLAAAPAESQAVLSEPLAYLAHQVISDEPARWPSLGYPNALEIGRPAGARVGRTADGRQVWAAGYTAQRLAVTWMSLPANAVDVAALDVRSAAGLWHALLQYASRDLPAVDWAPPAGITRMEICSPSGLLPTLSCPTIVSEVFLTGNEPTGPDTLYRTFQIDRESGRLATIFTPPGLVEERTYLVLPPEARPWGQLAGLPVPPVDYDRIQPPDTLVGVKITSPAQFAVVRGMVVFMGEAGGEGFAYYQLHAGQGLNPGEWQLIGSPVSQPVKTGVLGYWDTRQQNGLFAVRLLVVRQDQRLDSAVLQLTVDNTPPRVRILTPFTGQSLPFSPNPVTLQVDASDAVGLQRVEFLIDGMLTAARTAAPYRVSWPPLRGSHTFKVIAIDLAGNSSEAEIQFFIE